MEEKKNSSKILIGVIVVLVAALLAVVYLFYEYEKDQENKANEEELLIKKEELQDEYEMLNTQYEGFQLNLKNDSLLHKIDNEKAKVQRLLEELKTVKANDRAEISRLTKELGSLRKILKHYVAQMDSLNRVNEKLTKENKEIKTKYQATSSKLNEISKQKESLTEKVTLAAKLDAFGVNVTAANKKGKPQKNIKKVEQIIVNFTVAKNITAEPGERTIFVRIMKPDDNVLVKNRANVFPYENKEINYSMKRVIEYGGEEVGVTLYWAVEEYLMPGDYRVDIFADGARIGSKKFSMGKK